jgi:acyl-CoA hydrolase
MTVPTESDFQRYKRRAMSAREAVDLIGRGKTVFIGTAAG